MRNVFVFGLDSFNLETMRGLRESRRYVFHPLLPASKVHRAPSYDLNELIEEADQELRDFGRTVDAIVTWWDFPSTALLSVITELWDLYGPDLESVLTLEHKYWSRLVQQQVAPDHVPPFAAFDPFSDESLQNVLDAGLKYPFWVKPVKSVASYLGFRIEGPEDFEKAIIEIRDKIGQYGDPFQQALDRLEERPHEIDRFGGNACLAEGIISGSQCTLEGYVTFGNIHVYGAVDSLHYEGASTFHSYQYPSKLPVPVLRRMEEITENVIAASGLDHSCFNIEFFYNEEQGRIWLLEVNVRLSQSHCDLFAKVDGASSQRVMIDVAKGRVPRMPRRLGDFGAAAKFFLRTTEDGIVRSVPSEETVAAIEERFPGTRIRIAAQPDMTLSDMGVQDSYSYELGWAFVGADDREQLAERIEEIEQMLTFEIDPVT